jgi:hypothetical protein
MRRSTVEAEERHPRRKPPPLLPVLVVGGIVACWFGFGIWRGVDIAIHERRIGGTVTGLGSHGVIRYRYTIDGHQYFDEGRGDFSRIYPKDSPVEVRYSLSHPAWSTLDDPLLFPKQVACAATIVGGVLICMYVVRKRRRRAA